MWNFFHGLRACADWQCVNSFASWFSTALTLVISGSALFISIRAYRYAKQKDVEALSISIGTCILATPPKAQNAFSITVTNVGHRSASLKNYSWGARMPFSQGSQFITFFLTDDFTKLSAPLPAALDDGEEAQFFQSINVFDRHPTFLYHPSQWRAWLLINSLSISVTTTRRSHHQRLPKGVRRLIWTFYKQYILSQK